MNAQPHTTTPNHGTQAATFDNPMGIDGFEFVEFASPEPQLLHEYFRTLGFTPVARHRTRKITNYRQGDCTLDTWHCPTCGCTTHWTPVDPAYPRMGVNLRMFDPGLWGDLPRRLIDGASF